MRRHDVLSARVVLTHAALVLLALSTCSAPVNPVGNEVCSNNIDDNSDGKIDCLDPKCIDDVACTSSETCDNAKDDNGNGKVDCADSACEGRVCGASCLCVGGQSQYFVNADGGADAGRADAGTSSGNSDAGGQVVTDAGASDAGGTASTDAGGGFMGTDAGMVIDAGTFADAGAVACTGTSCGTGCACISNRKTETACGDSVDNDGNLLTDCADPACLAISCGPGCECGVNIKREVNCSDGIDNNGLSGTDCADPDCNARSCGASCLCAGGVRTETNCTDGVDNDGDGPADCADSNCIGAGPENCGDNVDNNCDRAIDCADTLCAVSPSCATQADGTRCIADGQCASGKCATEASQGNPQGLCTNAAACNATNNTGCSGGFCTLVGGVAQCRTRCTGVGMPNECRPGYACFDPDNLPGTNNSYCVALCTDDAQCAALGASYGCNPQSKRCEQKNKGQKAYGEACSTNNQCEGGVCLTDLTHPSGYCTGPCRADTGNCAKSPVDGYCDSRTGDGDNVATCLKRCALYGNCREVEHYGCFYFVGIQPGLDADGGVCQCLPAGYGDLGQPQYCCSGSGPGDGGACL